jgi:hypothetical protein
MKKLYKRYILLHKKKVHNLLDGNRITAAWLYSLSLELRQVPEKRKQ